ncbi:hypothetical protein BGZ60DRAFT_419826 [Tricladium varicosporioides]|nr:hypothetical protein BGZ60DRAFT_419826 [Hymenoscyphus varicosporioides]
MATITLDSISQRVNLRHPAYDRRHDLLLSLFAWDATTGGICYSLAHDACAIIADNHHEGWLAESPMGEPLNFKSSALLPAGDYWYHLPSPDAAEDKAGNTTSTSAYRWPVVTCFQDWEFPDDLPSAWTTVAQRHYPANADPQLTYASIVRSRDLSCRITKHYTGTEVVHLCPEQEREWFQANAMYQYNSNTYLEPNNLQNDTSNLILLRSDLHEAFNDRLFCLYPKGNDFAVHVMEPTRDIGLLYHNTRIHPINACRAEFIYTRFAWSLFPALSGFLMDRSTTRLVITVTKSGGQRIRQVEEMDAEALQARTNSRSRSPTNRLRAMLDTTEAAEGGYSALKRRRINCTTSSPQTSTAEDGPNYSQVRLDQSPLRSLQDDIDLEKKDEAQASNLSYTSKYHQQLREQYLRSQRPAGFVPRTDSLFGGSKNVREILERAGVEIRDDSSEADEY